MANMVQCGICLEEYQEGDLELHRPMCVLRLMFRCSLCAEDFVSKEGLWNHLDLHEIVDESKEFHYQEIKAKHKLHQCVLCNDQRAFSESPYWKHVHDVHDGFFLRCSDCGENFRSEELKNDHVSSRCTSRNETVTSDSIGLSELSGANNGDINISDKKSEMPTSNSAKSKVSWACNICGASFYSKGVLLRHQRAKYSCLERSQRRCPNCRRLFQLKEYQAHLASCGTNSFLCDFCPLKFDTAVLLNRHKRQRHRRKKVLQNEKQDQNQKMDVTDESSDLNVAEDRDTSTVEEDIAGRSVQLLVEDQTGGSSDTKCTLCGKECVSANFLRRHISSSHQQTPCNICGLTFEGYTRARHHKIVEHTAPKYECAKCSKKFHFIKMYERHSNTCGRSKHKNSEDFLLEEWSVRKASEENPSSEASCHKCSHCGIAETSPDSLARHILMHHDPVACDFCGMTLSNLARAQHHMKTMHKRSKSTCPHCSMKFSWTKRMETHVSHCQYEIVPCDYCGRMFRDDAAVRKHKNKNCRKRTMEQEQKSSMTDSFFRTKCYLCDEECAYPGYLNHHMRTHHELTKCDICGMTVIGITENRYHKQKYHIEPKHECPNCGEKFHNKKKFHEHCFACERKLYSCKLCARTFTQMPAVKRHNLQLHPEETNFANIEIVQDSTQVQSNDAKMESTAEQTTISARDDHEQSSVDLSSEAEVSNVQSSAVSLASLDDAESMDNQVIFKASRTSWIASLTGSSEREAVLKKTTQPLAKNLSNQPYSCKICGATMRSYSQVSYHMVTKHTEAKLPCPLCSRKFHYKRMLNKHVLCCASLKHSCDLCGQKFNVAERVESHKKEAHQDNKQLGNVYIETADCTEEQRQKNVEKVDGAEDLTDDVAKDQLSFPKHVKKYDDSQLQSGVQEAHANSTNLPQSENINLNLEIKVEDPMLQEQEYRDPYEDSERKFATTSLSYSKHIKEHDDPQFEFVIEEAHASSTNVPQGQSFDSKLEIKLEPDPMLQEHKYQDSNADSDSKLATTLEIFDYFRAKMPSCKHDPNKFCFVCGDFFHHRFKGHPMNDKLKEAYRMAFGRDVEDLDQAWAPSRICASCATFLYKSHNGELRPFKHSAPRTWSEPKDHSTDCFFCLSDVRPGKRPLENNPIYASTWPEEGECSFAFHS